MQDTMAARILRGTPHHPPLSQPKTSCAGSHGVAAQNHTAATMGKVHDTARSARAAGRGLMPVAHDRHYE